MCTTPTVHTSALVNTNKLFEYAQKASVRTLGVHLYQQYLNTFNPKWRKKYSGSDKKLWILPGSGSAFIQNDVCLAGLSSVNMQMTLPKTDITVRTGGTHLELQLPETFMSMLAGTVRSSDWQDCCFFVLFFSIEIICIYINQT